MPDLSDIVGQDEAVGRLQRAMAGDRMPHAFLFLGPAGVGRRTTALALAGTLLCEQPTTAPNAGRYADLPGDFPLRGACGACCGCRMAAADAHPDLHVVYKELARYHDDIEVRERKMQRLGIDVIDSFLIGPAYRSPARGGGKVFIVLEADLMSREAQNAALKTLEEPPPGVTIVLVGLGTEQLLPTTLSRCCPVQFGPLPPAFVKAKLAEAGVDEAEADFWSAFAGGSVGRALRLARQGLYEAKRDLVARLADLAAGRETDFAERMAKLSDKLADAAVRETRRATGAELATTLARRRAVGDLLDLITSAYREALFRRLAAPLPAIHVDQPDVIDALARRFPADELAEIIEQLARFEQLLWRNVNPKIVWDNVAVTCAAAAPLRT